MRRMLVASSQLGLGLGLGSFICHSSWATWRSCARDRSAPNPDPNPLHVHNCPPRGTGCDGLTASADPESQVSAGPTGAASSPFGLPAPKIHDVAFVVDLRPKRKDRVVTTEYRVSREGEATWEPEAQMGQCAGLQGFKKRRPALPSAAA